MSNNLYYLLESGERRALGVFVELGLEDVVDVIGVRGDVIKDVGVDALIWHMLDEYFEVRVKTKIKNLKTQLKTFKKQGSIVAEYIAKFNQVTDSLNALIAPLTKEEYIEAALGGLNEEYSVFITVTTTRMEHMSESDLESRLLTQEELINRFRNTKLGPVHANVAQSSKVYEKTQDRNYNNYSGRGGFREIRGRGYPRSSWRLTWWQGNRLQCQLYEKVGHTVVQYYHRFN
ncbi:uncharacterized protein LOC130974409 [Arachis stenosperma]|uniref:uncharacterized protein LOC130974409 n=1 Tax=Arachis stenosperma TaxID=217475 RepID=UPI0025ABEC5D|nr:uncharacterized protein LOC130974409 [Arachis stenosperma]